ncbi:MAG: HAD family phosphatase [Chloroflexi bacterium]|nr:HAD family phosphatase [Chloroflexota bacterium]
MLKALIFDFDGLILDTETPEVLAWQSIYREYGFELPLDEWSKVVGGWGVSNFDAALHLASISHGRLDSALVRARHQREADKMIHASSILPGVLQLLQQAKAAGLKIAIGSSSTHAWVDSHVERLGILPYFDCIVCQDDVPPGRTKPHPDIFLEALARLKVRAAEAVVFEDSLNGVTAARRAGIFVVGVPNPLTAQMGVRGDVTLPSLEHTSLRELDEYLKRR